jgi:hypothetical protein
VKIVRPLFNTAEVHTEVASESNSAYDPTISSRSGADTFPSPSIFLS